MAKKIISYPVAPNSVYVWRGFMSPPPQTYEAFASFLGSVFVPACALLQPAVGLRAYIPSMVPQKGKPAAVPDQTALMFWATPQSHDLANGAIAVRIYQNLHGDVYDMQRSHLPEIPVLLPTSVDGVTAEQPYYLFEDSADWMLGRVQHFVGARPENITPHAFLTSIYNWASTFKINTPKGIDAAIICCGNDYAVVWIHANNAIRNFSSLLNGFSSLTKPQLNISPRSTSLNAGLWNKWAGIDLTLQKNTSLNIQFNRLPKTTPVK